MMIERSGARRRIGTLAGIALATLSVGCRRIPVAVSQVGATPSRPAAAVGLVATKPAAPVEPERTDLDSEHGPQRKDSLMYEVHLVDARRCEERAEQDGAIRIAVRVAVTAHVEGLLVAARDFTLEHGGIRFETSVAGPTVACGVPLLPRSLHKGGTAQGTVVFRLPDARYAESARLLYEATRWGGAPRIELPLPDCRGDCRELAEGHSMRRRPSTIH